MACESQLKVSAKAAFQTAHKNGTCQSWLASSLCSFTSKRVVGHVVPVWWVSFSWPTRACCWLAGTALWGHFQCNSEFHMNWCRSCRPPLWWFSRRERGRQPWVHLSSQNRVSSHPGDRRHNTLPGTSSVFSLKPQVLYSKPDNKTIQCKLTKTHSFKMCIDNICLILRTKTASNASQWKESHLTPFWLNLEKKVWWINDMQSWLMRMNLEFEEE